MIFLHRQRTIISSMGVSKLYLTKPSTTPGMIEGYDVFSLYMLIVLTPAVGFVLGAAVAWIMG